MTKTTLHLGDQMRRHIRDSGLTCYRICKTTGIAEAVMSRFMTGRGGLRLSGMEKVADLLGLELVARGGAKPKRKAR